MTKAPGAVALLLILPCVACYTLAGATPNATDDVFILLVYVRHFLEGGGYYWNAQDGPIDGFTSFLDLWVKAGLGVVLGDLVLAAFVGTILPLAGCALLAAHLGRKLSGRSAPTTFAAVAGLLVASNPQLSDAASFLLEGPLFLLVTLLAATTVVDRERASSTDAVLLAVALIALVFVRPEGIPIALAFAAYWAFKQRAHGRVIRWAPVGTCALAAIVYFAFRLTVFGTLAPNTYYAKASSSRWLEVVDGLNYLLTSTRTPQGAALVLVASFGWLPLHPRCLAMWREDAQRTRYAFVWALASLVTLMTIVAGGDCYEGGRFLVIPVSLTYLAIGVLAVDLRARWAGIAQGALVMLLLVQLSTGASQWEARTSVLRSWPLTSDAYGCDREFASALTEAWPDLTVAESDYQRLKFWADEVHVEDLHGLNNRELAHTEVAGRVTFGKYSHAHAIATQASVLIWGVHHLRPNPISALSTGRVVSDRETMLSFTGYHEMLSDPEQRRAIAQFTTASVSACGGHFNFLIRRDLPAPVGSRVRVHEERAVPDGGFCMDFGTEDAREFMREGFSGDERDGARSFVWSDGPASHITLPPRSSLATVQLWWRAVADARPIRVRALIAGNEQGAWPVDTTPSEAAFTIPANAAPTELDLVYDRTVQLPTDSRNLAVQFERLCLQGPAE
jgi:hypothetical protein